MGAFIETQQAILSEEKQKRLEREERQRIKKKQEEAERNLFYKLDVILENKACKYFRCKTTQGTYKYLLKYKDNIIFDITKNENILYFLDRKYIKILNETYKKYQVISTIDKQKQKDNEKEAEKKLHKIIKNKFDFLEMHTKNINKTFKTYFEIYNFLSNPLIKDEIIDLCTNNENIKFLLNKKYMTILNNIYKPYKQAENKPKAINKKQAAANITKTEAATITGGAILLEAFKITAIVILTPLAFITSLIVHKR